jgi:hypothetical protein
MEFPFFPKFSFIFELAYINNTRFHCDNSIHKYCVLWTIHSLHYITLFPLFPIRPFSHSVGWLSLRCLRMW